MSITNKAHLESLKWVKPVWWSVPTLIVSVNEEGIAVYYTSTFFVQFKWSADPIVMFSSIV